MTGPRDIIRRASARKNIPAPQPPVPAPAPMETAHRNSSGKTAQWRTPPLMPPARESGPSAGFEPPEGGAGSSEPRVPVPRNIGGHAIYRELMRSHDRMGTRHIGKGG